MSHTYPFDKRSSIQRNKPYGKTDVWVAIGAFFSFAEKWLVGRTEQSIYYFSIDELMSDLNISKPTCIKALRELDSENGIGLIERVRRGLGKPDIIYVKDFSSLPDNMYDKDLYDNGDDEDSNAISDDESDSDQSGADSAINNNTPEVKKLYFRKSENLTSEGKGTLPAAVKELAPNYKYTKHIKLSYTDINHINQSEEKTTHGRSDTIDENEKKYPSSESEKYKQLIKKNIQYAEHMIDDSYNDRVLYDEMYKIICDIVCINRKTVRIGKIEYPYEIVKSRFLKLTDQHLEYVRDCIKQTNKKVGNVKMYLITSLYSAPETIEHYYQLEINHDMYG